MNTRAFLDWIVAMGFAAYKTQEFPDYKPSGPSHWYLKGSLERFTSAELIKIYSNKMSNPLARRWKNALICNGIYKKRHPN